MVIGDVLVPVERLAEPWATCTPSSSATISRAVVFGHARDGNLHFVAQDFRTRPPSPATRPSCATWWTGVGKYDSAIKASTDRARNIAPFVRDEWGGRLR